MLAGVGRLHEVLGGAHLGGMAGLQAVPNEVLGVENVDLKDILGGRLRYQIWYTQGLIIIRTRSLYRSL